MSIIGTYTPPRTVAELELASRIHRHVDILAGLIGPRHLGKPSSIDAAIAYIERELREIGDSPRREVYSMGSQRYARDCRKRGERIVGMICLEMVGYYSTESKSQRVPPLIPRLLRWAFPGRGDFLAAVANLRSTKLLWTFRRGFRRTSRFPLYSVALPERINEIRLSDNGSFWDQGYPAIMVTDTSFLRNPHYHLASDTPETLDYGRLTMATLGVAGGIARIAGFSSRRELP